jgi:hypothetical protein
MLFPYRCYIASLGGWQPRFAAIVAAREMLYLGSTVLAVWQCPVFLLMDPVTAWKEAEGRLERVQRATMYVLTPHNYTALCLANRFRGWRRTFLGLAGIQVLADISSCLGLAALIEGAIEQQKDPNSNRTPTAIIIGYVITASGFILFFGPLSVATSLKGAADKSRHSCVRAGLGLAGGGLLCALLYTVLLYVLLIGGWFNPYCNGFTFNSDPCNSNGECYGVAQCRCDPGFGPNASYTGEPRCACHPACVQGTCGDDDDDAYKCNCRGEWTGAACTDGPCVAHNDCGAHGDCRNDGDGHACDCHGEWTGDVCTDEPCVAHNDCGDHGDCRIDGDRHACDCHGEWTGGVCTDEPCVAHNDCGDHGDCRNDGDGHACDCKDGYYESTCELPCCSVYICGGTCCLFSHCPCGCSGYCRSGC